MEIQDPIRSEEVVAFHKILLDVKPDRMKDDGCLSLMDTSKMFTVRSHYGCLSTVGVNQALISDSTKLLQQVWKSATPSKVSIFCWRLFLSSLPKCALLHHRNIIASATEAVCPFCRLYCEDIQDTFLDCIFAKKVWVRVLQVVLWGYSTYFLGLYLC